VKKRKKLGEYTDAEWRTIRAETMVFMHMTKRAMRAGLLEEKISKSGEPGWRIPPGTDRREWNNRWDALFVDDPTLALLNDEDGEEALLAWVHQQMRGNN